MKTVKFGQVGLGRLGSEHARNLRTMVSGAELIAICDVDEGKLNQAADGLNVPNRYTDFGEMCKNPEIDAIAIVSPSAFHVDQIRVAMDNGKHIFAEKPLDVTVEKCKEAEKIVEAHPELRFVVGFMRRFDRGYMDAKKKIDEGAIGRVVLIRCYSQDPRAIIEANLEYAPRSGGQFLDMNIHDIDVCNFFTNGQLPKNLWSIGGQYEFPQYKEWDDGDNVGTLIQYEDDTMAFMFANRTAPHGSNVEAEIVGTHGTLRIAGTDSMLDVMNDHGICREYYQDFVTRWHNAYINEMQEFTNAIRDGRQPEGATVYDGTAALETAFRCKESFIRGEMLPFRG